MTTVPVLPLPLLDTAPARPLVEPPAYAAARLRAAAGRPVRYHLVTLGCPKNTVDSDTFERRLQALGCVPVIQPREADVLVANTCGFIEQSQAESINTILHLAATRKRRQRLIAAGCLVTLNRAELLPELPEVTAFFDPNEWDSTVAAVAGHGLLPDVTSEHVTAAELALRGDTAPRAALAGLFERSVLAELPDTPPVAAILLHDIPAAGPVRTGRVSAYLKISDGCNAPCTFCIIPQIKGRLTSASAPDLARQASRLRAEGSRELVLVAQDSTAYGEDQGDRDALAGLLRLLAETVPDTWLRLMYAYPGRVSDRLIQAMVELPQVVHYLDVPLQHGSAATLRRMRRPANLGMVRRMIADLRAAMPNIALRTSLITGFPGETDQEFEELLAFVQEIQFDHVGVFTYSQQERAVSGAFAGQVAEQVKLARRRRVMEVQQGISLAKHQALVGSELVVLVEGIAPPPGSGKHRFAGPVITGRSHRDAPEVDGLVIASGEAIPGTFVRVRITEAAPYDLYGEVLGPAGVP